jgi:hypothetical protein
MINKMTPEEKAKDLYDSYWYCLFQSNIEKRNYWSKQCALIAVDEMLDFRNGLYINEGSLAHKYLLDIKQEIKKL